MELILGIDVGGSTTKIVGFDRNKNSKGTLQVKAGDQLTSLYGALGHFLKINNLSLTDISEIALTGVGASLMDENIYNIPTFKVNEFEAIGKGGLFLSGLSRALIVSMGTGTAYVQADQSTFRHIGGTGVGGGTLVGLSWKLLKEDNIPLVSSMALKGNLRNVDLSVGDISKITIPSLPPYTTAANFGKIEHTASREDMAYALINMVLQTVGMMAVFACIHTEPQSIVLTGTLTTLHQAEKVFEELGALHHKTFIIPENSVFATAIGAVLCRIENKE